MGDGRRPDPPGQPVQPPRLPPPGYPDCCAWHRAGYERHEVGRAAANDAARPDPFVLARQVLDATAPRPASIRWQVGMLLRAATPEGQ